MFVKGDVSGNIYINQQQRGVRTMKRLTDFLAVCAFPVAKFALFLMCNATFLLLGIQEMIASKKVQKNLQKNAFLSAV